MKILSILFAAVLLTISASAGEPKKPTLKLSAAKVRIKQGATVNAKLSVKVPKTWHIYGIIPKINNDGIGPQATEITLKDSTKYFTLGAVQSPKPIVEYDDGFEMDVESLHGTLKFILPITADKSAILGKYKSTISIYFQMCDGKNCMTPEENLVSIPIEIIK